MDSKLKKFAALAVAGLVATSAIGSATPALAGGWGHGHHGGGWGHGGGYGWGGRGYGVARPGWGYAGYGWRGGGYRGGYGWGAPVAAGVLGALAVGAAAAAASQPYYGYGGAGYGCYPANQPVLDGWGNVVAYRRVQVCD